MTLIVGIVDLKTVPVGAYCAAGLYSEVPGDTLKRILSSNTPMLNQISNTKETRHSNTIEAWFNLGYNS